MDALLGHGFGEPNVIHCLGPPAVHLAALGKSFSSLFCLQQVRQALLARHSWLLVSTGEDEKAFAVRSLDGVCLPWAKTFQIETTLYIPSLQLLLALDCCVQGSTLWAWGTNDCQLRWRRQTGMKLLRPIIYVESACAVCAGTFDGVFMWSVKTGSKVWQATTTMPVDRLWFSPEHQFVFARTSEVLGLASELLVWDAGAAGPPSDSFYDASRHWIWTKSTMEMIMALMCYGDAVYARLGVAIFAWSVRTGTERWQKQVPSLPRLPTLPTHMLYSHAHDLIFIGVGNQLFAWKAKTSEEVFRIEAPGSLVRQFLVQESGLLVGLARGSTSTVVSWDSVAGSRLWQKSIFAQATQVSCMACRGRVVYIGANYGDADRQEGLVEAWDIRSGEVLWRVLRGEPVSSLWCGDEGVVFVGQVGGVIALSAESGSMIWCVEINGMAKALTFVAYACTEVSAAC
mmetsp:Transcript_34532/g.95105  ORF Transcript_34532/g.95105 Transcript_34532/m.95105 type:complete len:457 (-) Transcript_34532:173-1543(-)